jgi:hypothetical protein
LASQKRLAKKIVDDILDEGLMRSTWKDNNEGAYAALCTYREDLIANVERVLQDKKRPDPASGAEKVDKKSGKRPFR